MPTESTESRNQRRESGNERIMATDHLGLKRYMRLDTTCYEDNALPGRTKELLGLAASMVLRCNDCIDYHLEQCVKHGYTKEEIVDAMNVALIVGGSIVIPHLRHALETLEGLIPGNLES